MHPTTKNYLAENVTRKRLGATAITVLLMSIFKKRSFGDWRDGSTARSIYYSCRGPQVQFPAVPT